MTVRTVTFSPGFDHLVHVDALIPAGVGRTLSWQTVAAGKGVNVARVVHQLGAPSIAYSLIGAAEQERFVMLIENDGVGAVTVPVPSSTRDNLTLWVGDQVTASHNPGPRLEAANDRAADELLGELVSDVQRGDIVTFNGGIPGTIRSSVWADIAEEIVRRGAKLVADVQGEAFTLLLATGCVDAAKPNAEEVLAILGIDVSGSNSSVEVAGEGIRVMWEAGVAEPMVTVGAQGVVHRRDDETVISRCYVDSPKLVVGAGDAFLAGYCAAHVVSHWPECSPVLIGLAAASAHVAGFDGENLVRGVHELLPSVNTSIA